MGKVKIIFGLIVFALIASTAWQIAACEFANFELKDDLKDLSTMNAAKIGLEGPGSDEELRQTVIRRAAEHDIQLVPDQIFVQRIGATENPKLFLVAKYRSRVALPGISLILHFTATSR